MAWNELSAVAPVRHGCSDQQPPRQAPQRQDTAGSLHSDSGTPVTSPGWRAQASSKPVSFLTTKRTDPDREGASGTQNQGALPPVSACTGDLNHGPGGGDLRASLHVTACRLWVPERPLDRLPCLRPGTARCAGGNGLLRTARSSGLHCAGQRAVPCLSGCASGALRRASLSRRLPAHCGAGVIL